MLVIRHRHATKAITAEGKVSTQAPEGQERDLQSALLSIEKAEQQYIEAIRTLNDIVDKRKASLNPNLVAELERNLKIVNEAIASAHNAYHTPPADPELAHYMLKAYQKKVELLQDLALGVT